MQLLEDKPLSSILPKEAMGTRRRLTELLNIRTVNELLRHTRGELDSWCYRSTAGETFFRVLTLSGLELNTIDVILEDPAIPEVINYIDAVPDVTGVSDDHPRLKNLKTKHWWPLIRYCQKDASRFKSFAAYIAHYKTTRDELAQLNVFLAQPK
jgi:hypothetical protein